MTTHLIDTEALRELADAATEGPWPLLGGGEYVGGVGLLVAPDDGGVSPADAEFIAAAREAVPALLDENAALRARIKAVRELHVKEPGVGTAYCIDCEQPLPCDTIRALTA